MSILGNEATLIKQIGEIVCEDKIREDLKPYFVDGVSPQDCAKWPESMSWIKGAVDLAWARIEGNHSTLGKDFRRALGENATRPKEDRLRITLGTIPDECINRHFVSNPLQPGGKEEIIDLQLEEYNRFCVLGLYCPDKKKIILDDCKIKQFAEEEGYCCQHLFVIVLFHELMHFLMDPNNQDLNQPRCGYPDISISSFWMEESYANALMLQMLSGRAAIFTSAKRFVTSQPNPYKFGLQLMSRPVKYQIWIKEKLLILANTQKGPVYLISCSATKYKWCEDLPARVLYLPSALFSWSYLYALKNQASAIYILSDKHHLIGKDSMRAYYDVILTKKSIKAWHTKVNTQLAKASLGSNVVVLAGSKYCNGLAISDNGVPLKGMRIGDALHFLKYSVL